MTQAYDVLQYKLIILISDEIIYVLCHKFEIKDLTNRKLLIIKLLWKCRLNDDLQTVDHKIDKPSHYRLNLLEKVVNATVPNLIPMKLPVF